jgi:hypothetical protein
MNVPIYFWFELLALLVCLIVFKAIRHTLLIYFSPYLLLIVLYEFGTLKGWFTINGSNLWAVNIITTIEFIFYGLTLSSIIKKRKIKRLLTFGLCIVITLTAFNIFFIQGFHKLHTYTFLLGSSFLIVNACYFFYEILNDGADEKSILKRWFFWIVTGILFFYIGQFVFFCFFEYLIQMKDIRYRILFDTISSFSNAILYTCIIIALLCQKKITQES